MSIIMPLHKHLFLDLEDTVITPVVPDWESVELINIGKVRAFIETWQPDHVHLFSFAVHDAADRAGFSAHVRGPLERAIGRDIEMTPSTDEHILPACCQVLKLHPSKVDFDDMSAFWSKHEAFRLFVRHLFRSSLRQDPVEVALLDDAVLNEHFSWPDLRISGRILNIDLMA